MPSQFAADAQTYLKGESSLRQAKTKEAEAMLNLGNNYLQNGDPQQARRAFQSAYGLSQGDDAFNEDSRVRRSSTTSNCNRRSSVLARLAPGKSAARVKR